MTRTSPSTPAARQDFWSGALRGWDLGFFGLVLVAAISIAIDTDDSTVVTGAVAGLGVLVLAYLGLGRPGAVRGDVRRTTAYLVVLVAVVGFEVWLADLGPVLLFIAYSQIWFFATSRLAGALWSVALTVVFAGAIVLREPVAGDDLGTVIGQVTAVLVFSLVLGLWVTWVSERSEERQGLVEKLSAAQDELAATSHTAGVLAERARLAQEIHDTLAQGFTSVVMLSQAASAQLAHGRVEPAADRVAQIEQVARDSLVQARALVAAFGPPELEDSSLGEALERLASRFAAETHVTVEVGGLGGLGAIPPESSVVLLRAAQEALANVRKHAGARAVRLTVTREDGDVRLEVADDGRGLPEDVVDGVGLRGMRDRVDAGGGTLEVGNAPGGGTRVALTLPAADGGAS